MNFFEFDYLKKTELLMKEAFKFKKYKAMSPVLAVFTGILMIPLVAASFVVTAILAVLGFIFVVSSAVTKYLHDVTHGEGQAVKHATQVVVYLVSWPVVFLGYILKAILLCLILPCYALLSVLTYAWTLGGFKFHLLPNRVDDIAIEVEGKYLVLPIIFVCVGYLLVAVIPLFHALYVYGMLEAINKTKWFAYLFTPMYMAYIGAHTGFSFLYSHIGFGRAHVAKAKAEEIAE